MREHGLARWKFQFQPWPATAGKCVRTYRLLVFSDLIFAINEEAQVRDVITHEIAHALTDGAHTSAWRAMHKKLGGSGEVEPPGLRQGRLTRDAGGVEF